MPTRHPVAAPCRAVQHASVFTTPDQVKITSVVYDRDYDMPATVRSVDGQFVELERPTGLVWRRHYHRLRPASDWEKRQLVAVGRLHKQRQRGLA